MPRTTKEDSKKKKVGENVRYWLAEIEAARKREKSYRTQGKTIREIYDGTKQATTPFNIVFANTEVMLPSMYSQAPRPIVQRRYKDNDAIGKAAATAAQRMLEFQIDTNIEGYETFHEAMKAATMDALLPGRGITSLKYEADTTGDVKQSEIICPESRSWDRVGFGYAKKWSKVPFVFYENYVDKEEATELFGKDIAAEIEFTTGENAGDEGRQSKDDLDTGERKTALIYQIWDKRGGRKIRYVSPHYKDDFLKVQDDPWQLTGFYNCPKPLEFIAKTDDLVPTALYTQYETQAAELNELTVRISRITKAIKARGLYAGEIDEDIGNLMEADDNALVPIATQVGAAGEKALSNAIWFMPLDVLIVTLRELYAAREACKQVIYEIMGISDIIRGASKASETLGAQQIKSQWGTLRIKPKQGEVQRYARDLLRMMVEIAALKFSQDTWAKMTGLQYLTDMQVQQLTQMAQVAQQAAQMGDQQAMQAFQQAQQQLQSTPKWADVIKILQDDLQRAYKIDIETNSTVEPEAAEDQKNIAELMTAIGQFLNGVGPMVAQGVMPFEVAQSMLMAITRRFRFGDEIEDQIKQMKPPAQQDESKGKAEAAEQKAAKTEMQATNDKIQAQAQIAQLQTQLKEAQAVNVMQKRESDLAIREIQVDVAEQQLKLERQAATESVANRSAVENTKLDHKKQITGLEQKQAKDSQATAQKVSGKLDQGVQTITQLAGSLEKMQQSLVEVITENIQKTQHLAAVVKAPRRKKAIRDETGAIQGAEDQIAVSDEDLALQSIPESPAKNLMAKLDELSQQVAGTLVEIKRVEQSMESNVTELKKAIKAPRVKKAIRDARGNIQGSIDEVVQ